MKLSEKKVIEAAKRFVDNWYGGAEDMTQYRNRLCEAVKDYNREKEEEDPEEWYAFRRSAAKDFVPMAAEMCDYRGGPIRYVKTAIDLADELIKQLKEREQ